MRLVEHMRFKRGGTSIESALEGFSTAEEPSPSYNVFSVGYSGRGSFSLRRISPGGAGVPHPKAMKVARTTEPIIGIFVTKHDLTENFQKSSCSDRFLASQTPTMQIIAATRGICSAEIPSRQRDLTRRFTCFLFWGLLRTR